MKYTIIKYDLASGEKTEIPLVFDTEEGYSYPSTFSMLEDGSYIGFLNSYSEDDESIDTKLVKLKKDGSVDEIVELS